MMKPVCCLFLALGLAACAPEKAVVIENPVAPATGARKPGNPTGSAPAEAQERQPTLINQPGGMRINEARLLTLPNNRDMVPTAPVAPGGGGVNATPPTADKGKE